ncbi:aminoacyl tRNA synthase complex-interacting multifunctional protein 2-like [Lytechinus variegatus]|uniref:aminoacyl tRNA synthase complex-interacting multifunctional protein 2-like n=1 Tax=Lytechinus variegatus TaxID=7654 RepID=UPI001BB2B174|nr:aminoacyl tRNA synthase complex-interacting multifunctional protein 2-like [Lytechinus variegatus]
MYCEEGNSTTMSGTSGMFKLKPFYDFDNTQIELPDCMFKMSNIQGNSSQTNSGEVDPAVAALECRQEAILADLRSMETDVASLTSKIQPTAQVKTPAPATSASQSSSNLVSGSGLHDVVIYANPNNPPYSLLVLYEQLKQQFRCITKVHMHSSISSVPDKLLGYFNQNGSQPLQRMEAQLSITLIWKNVSQGPEMKILANCQTPIQGEVNILRYLSRLLTPAYDASDDIITVANIDNFLDLASSTLLKGSSKEKAAGVRSLNSALGRGTWLAGNSPTVADIAVWSALHQTNLAKGAPSNVQKWLKSCATQSDFRTALSAVA